MALGDKRSFHRPAGLALVLAVAGALAGCQGGQMYLGSGFAYDGVVQRGYVADPATLNQLTPGTPAEKVLALLGTPSTTSTVGGDAWYYISQKVERKAAFMPAVVEDQRVLAVYFGPGKKLQRVANYGLQDGRLFDYLSRTTPVAGGDESFVQNMVKGLLKF